MEISTFIQQGCIKLIKSDSFQINAVLSNFLFIKKPNLVSQYPQKY